MDLNRYLQIWQLEQLDTMSMGSTKKIRVVYEKALVARQLGLSDMDLNRYLQKSWQLGYLDTMSRGSTKNIMVVWKKPWQLDSQDSATYIMIDTFKILVARVARHNVQGIHQKNRGSVKKKPWQLGSYETYVMQPTHWTLTHLTNL